MNIRTLMGAATAFLLLSAGNASATLLGLAGEGEGGTDTQLVTIDTATGAATAVGSIGFAQVAGLAFDPNSGTLFGTTAATGQLLTIDIATGAGTAVGALGFDFVTALAFDPNSNTLFGVNATGGGGVATELLAINTATGTATVVGDLGLGITPIEALAFDPVSNTLFGRDTFTDQLLTIDTATGAATPVGLSLPGAFVGGLAFDPDSGTLFGANFLADELVTIDTTTGTATTVGALGFDDLEGLAFVTMSNGEPSDDVPEPGVFSLLALGLVGLGLAARRRRGHRHA